VDPEGCKRCHAGPAHHPISRHAEAACTACHHEHGGRQARLTRVTDDQCLRCHEDLGRVAANAWPRFAARVTGLAAHPPFRPWRPPLAVEVGRTLGLLAPGAGPAPVQAALALAAGRTLPLDPGRLAFDHALHLRPGLRPEHGGQLLGEPLTYDRLREAVARSGAGLPEGVRKAMGAGPNPQAVQLACAACHQLDRGAAAADFWQMGGEERGPRAGGAAMLPVTYEQHCRACHPLPFDSRPGLAEGEVPHPRQPGELRRWLTAAYTEAYLQGRLPAAAPAPARATFPGRGPDPLAAAGQQVIAAAVCQAEDRLYRAKTACAACHPLDTPPDPAGAPPRVLPPQVPAVWFRHARFSHTAHRAADCRVCHPQAYPTTAAGDRNPSASRSHQDVLLPTLATCLQCHADPTPAGGLGARKDCVQCHGYHNGDAPLAGPGSPARAPDPQGRFDLEGFLHPR
jgi:predicted CXXCH cytochrome family protein